VVVIVVVIVHMHDFDAAVMTALGAYAMGTARCMALGALGKRRGTDLVLRATLVRARVGLFLLWDGHSDEED
jgi:hypothetical protein